MVMIAQMLFLDAQVHIELFAELLEIIVKFGIRTLLTEGLEFHLLKLDSLMFQTYRGVTADSKSVIYLRPENAQGEYVNFLNVQRTMKKLAT